MHDDYFEILEAFDTEPLWYDCYGVPRWCTPEEAHYPEHLMGKIKCQRCGKEFWVALGLPVYIVDYISLIMGGSSNVVRIEGAPIDFENHKELQLIENWGYGDPPRHNGGCLAGDTMTSISEYEWEEFFGEDRQED